MIGQRSNKNKWKLNNKMKRKAMNIHMESYNGGCKMEAQIA